MKLLNRFMAFPPFLFFDEETTLLCSSPLSSSLPPHYACALLEAEAKRWGHPYRTSTSIGRGRGVTQKENAPHMGLGDHEARL